MMFTKSLRFKLNLTLVLVTTALLGAFAFWNAHTIRLQETQRMEQDTAAILQRLTEVLPATLWNFASAPAEKALQGELSAPAVEAIIVTDMDGNVFVQANKPNSTTAQDSKQALTQKASLSYMDGDTPNAVGTVTLRLTQKPVEQAVQDALVSSAIQILLLEILLSIALAVVVSRLVLRPLSGILKHIHSITQDHNLATRIRYQGKDELGELSTALNQFIDEIQQDIKAIRGATDALLHVASGSQQSHQQLQSDMSKQQGALDNLTAALQSISSASAQLSSNSQETTLLISNARQDTTQGSAHVECALRSVEQFANDASKSTEAIDQLRQEVDAITQVLDVIRGIAEQTNLLALNAAIEAARAGEQGRGFAVVADEVRALASRTQQSTREISETLDKLMQRTEQTVTAMRSGVGITQQTIENATQAGHSIQRVLNNIEEILTMSKQISAATAQQSRSLSDTDHSVDHINQAVLHTLEQAHNTSQLNEELLTTANTLNQLAGKFKT